MKQLRTNTKSLTLARYNIPANAWLLLHGESLLLHKHALPSSNLNLSSCFGTKSATGNHSGCPFSVKSVLESLSWEERRGAEERDWWDRFSVTYLIPGQHVCHSLIPRTVCVPQPHSQAVPTCELQVTESWARLGAKTMCLVNNLVIKYYSLKSSHTIRITNLLLVDLITRGLPIGSHKLYLLAWATVAEHLLCMAAEQAQQAQLVLRNRAG